MLEVTQLIGFGAGSGLGSFARSATLSLDNSSQTTYSFASTALGADASDREIVVCVHAQKASGLALPSSVTLAGNAMTLDAGAAAAGKIAAGIYRLAYPTGATATVAVTFASAPGSCAITVYRMTGRTMAVSGLTNTGTTSATIESVVHHGGSTMICGATENGTPTLSGWSADQTGSNGFAAYRTGIKTGAGGTISITTAGSTAASLASAAYG